MRVGSWLTAKKHADNPSPPTKSRDELDNLEDALRSVSLIMNDDVDGADKGLSLGHSSFHALGKGVVSFMRATMGFEPEVMREAIQTLSDAETAASNDLRRFQHTSNAFKSSIYPLGSEYSLSQAEAQLMGAVVAVLNESLTESIRGFYKLRKAYIALDIIIEAETRYLTGKSLPSSTRSSVDVERPLPGGFKDDLPAEPARLGGEVNVHSPLADEVLNADETKGVKAKSTEPEEDDDVFVDANESLSSTAQTTHYLGHVESELPHRAFASLAIAVQHASDGGTLIKSKSRADDLVIDHDPESNLFQNEVDIFIHSGATLCFGLLLLIISMIPPAFGKLLYIIGFKGDRERGLRMLWQSSKFHNIHGALAGLFLLGYYNGLVGFCDILPADEGNNVDGYPRAKCEALLIEMRKRYPKSHLWMLEQARMEAANKRIDHAIELLSSDLKSPLKQVEALGMFEKALNAMYSQNYELCSESFIKCVDLNNWSHALYFYVAGISHVEMYRDLLPTDPVLAAKHAEKATKYLKHAPTLTGKKKFMARQLPFDVFVSRKVQKWTHRASEFNVSFVDAVGVSPAVEMSYFWNGFKRMNSSQLAACEARLAWSANEAAKADAKHHLWPRESPDEKAILSLLSAVIARHTADQTTAERVLRQEILVHDRALFKGHLRDDWTAPSAHYEMAVLCWEDRRERGAECREWLDKAAKWESYDLDARIGLKVTTALETLKNFEDSGGAAA